MPNEQHPTRIDAIDIARGVALMAMAIYHFTWDLEFFGYVDPGTTAGRLAGNSLPAASHRASCSWPASAFSLPMAGHPLAWLLTPFRHGRGRRAGDLDRHLYRGPGGFIFFGILHQIALASLLGLAFLRLPALLTLLIAVAVIAAPHLSALGIFHHPAWWWWTGLSASIRAPTTTCRFFPGLPRCFRHRRGKDSRHGPACFRASPR